MVTGPFLSLEAAPMGRRGLALSDVPAYSDGPRFRYATGSADPSMGGR